MQFASMIEASRIQKTDFNRFILWTCQGDTGKYATYDDPDCDVIDFCPWCGNKLPAVSTDP
jgi:hypothetical protein